MDKNNHQNKNILIGGQANIEANQQGVMSAEQKTRLQQDMQAVRQQQLRQVYLSAVVVLVITVVLILIPYLSIPIGLAPLVWFVGVAVWYGRFWLQQKPIRDDLLLGKAESVTGYIDKSPTLAYHVTVRDVDYITSPEWYPLFNETLRYVIYYTPTSKIVLSAEVEDELSLYDS